VSYKQGKLTIKGLKAGSTIVTAKAAGNDAALTIAVTVTKRPNPVSIAATVTCGKQKKVHITDAKGEVTVKSSNKTVAKASYKNGKVTIKRVKKGHATITVTAKGTSTYAKGTKTVRVTVKR
jgi:hypothetical protein